uniref:TATA box-binding protein-associated factor RNA polymerase I subunit B isoform X2 n=1 Tax=Solea senegalensis TaxID=28829 RepID=UPI001CD90F72|nr:TATA box-binding protein-associated factor RNA polymerase I subunit B isoform X2 [Solea senegalensis]
MDDEHTASFTEACGQCSAVNWGISDEGRFYCRSCHNVIERTKEVEDTYVDRGSIRVSTLSRGSRTKRSECGRQWMICEGFQFILKNQADALIALGVSSHFKDQVLCQLWRLYLQRSRQAFTRNPVRSVAFKMRRPGSDSESAGESWAASASETDGDTNLSNAEDSSDWPQLSGSADALTYISSPRRRSHRLMSMRKTLALIHVALTWSRESLTLSDLLRLVNEGHVPFVDAYDDLPAEMSLSGKDALIFRVESVPSHRVVHSEAQALVLYLQLKSFPPISRQCLLHPALLSLRYLTDANLPDKLHPWLCRLMDCAGLTDQTFFTFDPLSFPFLPQFDVQTAAIIIVTMKLMFGLDDHTEWDLCNVAGVKDDHDPDPDPEAEFNLRRWYRVTHAALTRAQQSRECHDVARKQWKTKKPLFPSKRMKAVMVKRKRTAELVHRCFHKLSCPSVQRRGPSTFRFCWGDEDGVDGPSLHHKKLSAVLSLKDHALTPLNTAYWHPPLTSCNPRECVTHFSEMEAELPRSFMWLLQLFSFLLDVKPDCLYEAVLKVERRILATGTRSGRERR